MWLTAARLCDLVAVSPGPWPGYQGRTCTKSAVKGRLCRPQSPRRSHLVIASRTPAGQWATTETGVVGRWEGDTGGGGRTLSISGTGQIIYN